MVDGQRRDDEIERPVGERIFELLHDDLLDAILRQRQAAAASISADAVDEHHAGAGMYLEHAPRRLARPGAEVEDPRCRECLGCDSRPCLRARRNAGTSRRTNSR